MIRVIGLDDMIFDHIVNHNSNIIRNYREKGLNCIEFIPSCSINYQNGMVTIECSDNIVTFLCCDYWRIEIE